MFDAFGPDEGMQVYGRGLRRRLPPMLGGDERRVRLVYSLMMSLPGTPTLFYGEEIGMGENLDLEGRMAVRTPMQWQPGALGGFSRVADPAALCRPFPAAPYGPDQVNVVSQRHDPDSLFSFVRERIRCYRECPELGLGRQPRCWTTTPRRCSRIGATGRAAPCVLCHNLADSAATVASSLPDLPATARYLDLFDSRSGSGPTRRDCLNLDLAAYGARWFRVLASEASEFG